MDHDEDEALPGGRYAEVAVVVTDADQSAVAPATAIAAAVERATMLGGRLLVDGDGAAPTARLRLALVPSPR
jgi:hypothetical protein